MEGLIVETEKSEEMPGPKFPKFVGKSNRGIFLADLLCLNWLTEM